MAIRKATLTKTISGTREYIYPKTSADLVKVSSLQDSSGNSLATVQAALESISTDVNGKHGNNIKITSDANASTIKDYIDSIHDEIMGFTDEEGGRTISDAFDTLKEVDAYLTAHGSTVTDITGRLTSLESGKLDKPTAAIGSATKGIYFASDGTPTEMTYSVSKSVPSDALFTDTDTKVTSSTNHYIPSTASGQSKSASASGATAAWDIDVVKGVSLDTDGRGHVTGISVTSGKIPANPNTDRYVNSASFADDTTNSTSSPVKMTLTRAGSDSASVTASIPKVSSSSAGVAPKGAAVSSQSQSTKFLREDGTWAAPSYTTNTDTSVTSSANHYEPSTASGKDKTASASGASPTWGIDVVKGVTLNTDGKGHVTGLSVTSGKIPADPTGYANQNAFSNVKVGTTTIAADTTTDTLEIAAGSNITLTPDATNDKLTIAATDTTYSNATTDAAGLMSATDKSKLDGIASGANAYSHPTYTSKTSGLYKITVDSTGHVSAATAVQKSDITGLDIPGSDTDRYVNSASFADDTSSNSSSPLKMTLTRAGSDSSTVTANLPKVSSTSAGVAPKGAAVSSQSQSTKFLREDGTWAAPSYTTNTNTTYTFATGDSNGQIKVTPSSGSAQNISVKGLGSAAYTDSSTYVNSTDYSYYKTFLNYMMFAEDSTPNYMGGGSYTYLDPTTGDLHGQGGSNIYKDFLANIGVFKDAYGPIRVITGSSALSLIAGSSGTFSEIGSGFEGRVFLLNDEIIGAVLDKVYVRVQANSNGAVSTSRSFYDYIDTSKFGLVGSTSSFGYLFATLDGSNNITSREACYTSSSNYINDIESETSPANDYLTSTWSISGSSGLNVSFATGSTYSGFGNVYFYVKCPKKIYIPSFNGLFTKANRDKLNNLVKYGTSAYTSGSTSLTTGSIYVQYS